MFGNQWIGVHTMEKDLKGREKEKTQTTEEIDIDEGLGS